MAKVAASHIMPASPGLGPVLHQFIIMGKKIIQTISDGAGNRYHIPHRKIRKFKNNLVLKFCIPGIIPSKKNCQIPSINKKGMEKILKNSLGKVLNQETIDQVLAIKPFIRGSKRFKAWDELVKIDLVKQAARKKKAYEYKNLSYPISKCTITIYHYWANDVSRDNSNKAESIHDALVGAGIITNDDHQCLYKFSSEADVYAGEIMDHLTIFTVTAHEW